MAEAVHLHRVDEGDKEFIQKTLDCAGDEVFDIADPYLYMPFAFARENYVIDTRQIIKTERVDFVGTLRSEQTDIRDFVMSKISTDGCAIISACPGFGKTITALSVACAVAVKTVIVVNKLILIDQWIDSIYKFVPSAIVEVVHPKTATLNPSASFYIVNAINVQKHPHAFWAQCKLLIVDELHQIVTKKLIISLLRIVPDAVIGLSATPYRHDAYDGAIKWFFGTNIIGERLNRRHSFRIVHTGWSPQNIRYTTKGLDWGKILEEQSEDAHRNSVITRECTRELMNGKTVMILVKRVLHAEALAEKLKSVAKVATLVRSEKTFDKTCRVLIGTTSKIGVGFDHAPIDCLIVASDIKNYFVQFLGRCMRNQTVVPSVVDFSDNFSTLQRHLEDRIKEYKKHGGTEIKDVADCDHSESQQQSAVVKPRLNWRRRN